MIEYKPLPYSLDALEPVISSRTLEFHYGKHLRAYVDNLNKLIVGTKFEDLPLEEIVRSSSGAIFNNAGQVLNHNLYFQQFCPAGNHSELSNESCLYKQIMAQWGSFEQFQEAFTTAGLTLFGSGWVWLSAKPDGNLVISQESNASNPTLKGFTPILTFDVWEHAYYLDYQNRRADHLKALWSIINWRAIE